jgi:hypothetical protein
MEHFSYDDFCILFFHFIMCILCHLVGSCARSRIKMTNVVSNGDIFPTMCMVKIEPYFHNP